MINGQNDCRISPNISNAIVSITMNFRITKKAIKEFEIITGNQN